MQEKIDHISRVTRSHEEARASYDRLSRWYDSIAAPSEKPFRQMGLEMLAVKPGERVLEIAPGTGGNLLVLAEAAGEAGLVVGLDLSPRMLSVARGKLDKAGLLKRAALVQGDGTRLPFAAAAFDAMFIAFALELFDTPEIPRVLAGCRNALRPGGRLAVVSLLKEDGLLVSLYEWAHQHFGKVLDCRPIAPTAMVCAAGFEIAQSRRETMWGLPVEIAMGIKTQ